jgi:hypothetical protein
MRFRALTDLTLPSGAYVEAGSEYETDANYKPPTHACQPLDPDAIAAYWAEGARFSEAEPWRACYTNCNRFVGLPVAPPTTWWVKSGDQYILHGAGGNLGPKPALST